MSEQGDLIATDMKKFGKDAQEVLKIVRKQSSVATDLDILDAVVEEGIESKTNSEVPKLHSSISNVSHKDGVPKARASYKNMPKGTLSPRYNTKSYRPGNSTVEFIAHECELLEDMTFAGNDVK